MTDFLEWFDPSNREHCLAFQHLQKTGFWPEGFIPKDMKMPTNWTISIMAKMADLWANHVVQQAPPG